MKLNKTFAFLHGYLSSSLSRITVSTKVKTPSLFARTEINCDMKCQRFLLTRRGRTQLLNDGFYLILFIFLYKLASRESNPPNPTTPSPKMC